MLPFIKDEQSQNTGSFHAQNSEELKSQQFKSPIMQKYFQIKEVLLIDSQWEVNFRHRVRNYMMKIKTNNRVLNLKFKGLIHNQAIVWREKIIQAMQNSPWSMALERVVQDSFAPLRKNNKVKLMIDGEMYFRNLAEELKNAQSEIFICDWWICSKYYLVRPINLKNDLDNQQFRLDQLLLSAAKRGVQIYIVVWRESRFGASFDSF